MAGEVIKIDIRGAAEVANALGRVDRRLKADFLNALKRTLEPAVEDVKMRVVGEGLVDSGKLLRSVRPFRRGATLGIRVGATRGGFQYPAVYEYGHGAARAFLEPGFQQARPKVISQIERFLDQIVSEAGLGGRSGL